MTDQADLPDFELPATGTQRFQLPAFKGHPFVIYFYPRDNTPGCTDEGIQNACGIFRVMVPGHAQQVLDFVKSAKLPSNHPTPD
jgi:hypothetical protein